MKKNKKILKKCALVFFSVFCLFLPKLTLASGPFLPRYLHTPEEINSVNFLEYNNDYKNIDTPNQIVFEGLDLDQLLPLYRKMIGKPLSNDVKQALYFVVHTDQSNSYINGYSAVSKSWFDARDKKMKDGSEDRKINYDNCADITYVTATKTLADRTKIYSIADLKEWIKNQDSVFAVCQKNTDDNNYDGWERKSADRLTFAKSIGSTDLNIGTTSLETSLPIKKSFFRKIADFFASLFRTEPKTEPVKKEARVNSCVADVCPFEVKYSGQLQSDYEYQQALQAVYSSDLIRTEKYLKAISENKNSSWNKEATYLLGGFYLDLNHSIPDTEATTSKNLISLAREQYNKIYLDKGMKIDNELSLQSSGMLDYILSFTDSFTVLEKQTNILESSNNAEAIKRALNNMNTLWYSKVNNEVNKKVLMQGDNFSIWMLMWMEPTFANLHVIKDKYKETKNDAWLLLLARYIPLTEADFNQIETKVANLQKKSSLAFWSANYYIIKKEIDAGNIAKARDLISKLDTTNASVIVLDYINNLKMLTASTVLDLFKFSSRQTYEISGDFIDDKQELQISKIDFMDNKAKVVFETKLPLHSQVEILQSYTIFSPKQTEFGYVAIVEDFDGRKIELYHGL